VAKPAGFGAGTLLKLLIAEAFLLPLLGRNHIGLRHREALKASQLKEGTQGEWILVIMEATLQFRAFAGVVKEGVELLERHDGNGSLIPV
jgi:hypothetical protein